MTAEPSHPLRRWRDRQGWSTREAATAVLTSAATVSRIETGLQFPRPALLDRLTSITGLSANAFMRWRGSR